MRGLFVTIAIAALCLVPAGPALANTVGFFGDGLVTATGAPDMDGNLPQAVIEPTDYDFGNGQTWHLSATFSFNLPTGLGSGLFTFADGVDALTGTVTTRQDHVDLSMFALTYLVSSTSGIFAGFTGSGSSTVQLLGDPRDPSTPRIPFIEHGSFNLTPVPEPGSLVLIGLGLAGIVVSRQRRAWASKSRRP